MSIDAVADTLLPLGRVFGSTAMSRQPIAAVLAREDLSCGERLVAFSLSSFADRENRARAGTPAAAGRAGLGKSRFLEAREGLVHRGLLVVEQAASGRGRASTLALPFADAGPWWQGDINAELFEAVLGYSRSQGPSRLLVAAMAALADERGLIEELTTHELCAAAGFADRTYRRVRGPLVASGELVASLRDTRSGEDHQLGDPRPPVARSHGLQAASAGTTACWGASAGCHGPSD